MHFPWKKKESQTEQKTVWWVRTLALIALIVGLGLFSQVILAAAFASVGLVALGVIAALSIAVFQALPLLGQKWENWLLSARKEEARRNPIEQAENDYLRRSQQYEAFKAALEQIGGMVSGYGAKLEKTRREKPDYNLKSESEAYEKMLLFYQNRKDRLIRAWKLLEEYREKIEEARTKWDFQLQANAAIRAMNATDKEAKINEILTEVAFGSVQEEFNQVFAKLDVDAAEISAQKELTFAPGVSIDLSEVKVPQLESVGAH